MTLVSCTSEEYLGDNNPSTPQDKLEAINFGFNMTPTTRADQTGGTAASTLGSTFYVYGIKSESTDVPGSVGAGHTVFKNYKVTYTPKTAYTTTSNTADWEYVGKALTTNEAAAITDNEGTVTQTIKYWDYTAPDYTFYAFSAASADVDAASPKVTIAKTQTSTNVYRNGYAVTLAAGANMDQLFFSERVNITKTTGTDRTADNTYGGNVTLRFHKASAEVRVGMYETIDGYTVTINNFTVADDQDNPSFAQMDDDVTANFAANLCNSKNGDAGTMNVTYYASGTLQNQPILTFTPTTGNKVLALGDNLKATTVLNTSVTNPTYDKTAGAYTSVFPNIANTQNLKLKVTYTLTATSGETITVTDATAEIPANYLKWKPGYAYTYLFKISANTNGSTGTPGTDPAGLYPITFDAVATVTEDGLAEYITTVSEPSITTFGVKSDSYVVGKDDYETGTDIYATIMDGSSVATPVIGTNVNIYSVTTSDATNFPINEASVAESIAEITSGTKIVQCENINDDDATYFTSSAPAAVTAVPGEDGVNITINAVKLTGVKTAGKYAIEYVKTPATYHTTSAAYTFANAAAMDTEVTNNGPLYSNADGTTVATWENDTEHTYYRRTSVKTVGVYTYKIVTVVDPVVAP